jgi:hypothetical protein
MMSALLVETPNDVLLDGKQRIGPELLALHSGKMCIAIYGFSGKQSYDAFCEKSERALTPYPLVKGYLQNQLEDAGDTLLLVVVDAVGPDESHLTAATMQSVLEAREKQSSQVAVSFRLTRDEQSQAYRVENNSSSFVSANQ